ncbi:hypothetical protein KKH26_01335, partial [Patescibacteria group bacterium]|nr:hypothetical protein [Patescibacteria group bacterium]
DINFWLSGGTKKIILYHAIIFWKRGEVAITKSFLSNPQGISNLRIIFLIPLGSRKELYFPFVAS